TIAHGTERPLLLEEVEALLASKTVVVDACRHVVREAGRVVSLASRPVLFARAFRARTADESHRARLRVEVGRLRTLLRPLAEVSATKLGFRLVPHQARDLVVLAPPVDDEHAA